MSHIKNEKGEMIASEISYSETLVEISMVVERHYNDLHKALENNAEIRSKAIEWAMEFENINRHRNWDGEWLDEVMDFAESKIKEVLSNGNLCGSKKKKWLINGKEVTKKEYDKKINQI